MERDEALRRGPGLLLAVLLSFATAFARSPSAPQDDNRTCLVCHSDAELESSAGTPVFVDPELFAASVHGRAGAACVGCHADLKRVEDFPHAPDLEAVTCAGCHKDHGRASPGGVHGTSSPRLVARPVLCKDCHGYHAALRSSDSRSTVHAANRPATCAKCHSGAGANFSKGQVHELAPAARWSPAGIVRLVYRILIGVLTAVFLAYIGADLLRWRREQ